MLTVHADSLRHLRAVGLAVLIKRSLLTGRTTQPFIHFVIVVSYRRAGAAHGRVLVILGDASLSRARIWRDDGAAVHRPHKVVTLHPLEGRWRERREEMSLWLQRHRADVFFWLHHHHHPVSMQRLASRSWGVPQFGEIKPWHAHQDTLTKDKEVFFTYLSTLSRFSSSLSAGLSLPLRELLYRAGLPRESYAPAPPRPPDRVDRLSRHWPCSCLQHWNKTLVSICRYTD